MPAVLLPVRFAVAVFGGGGCAAGRSCIYLLQVVTIARGGVMSQRFRVSGVSGRQRDKRADVVIWLLFAGVVVLFVVGAVAWVQAGIALWRCFF